MRRHAIAQLRLAELVFGMCQVTDLRRQVTLRSMTYFERSCPDHTFAPSTHEKPNESSMEWRAWIKRRKGFFGRLFRDEQHR
jgi:hypothetical protein